MKQTVVLFDINETVLNLQMLRPKFKDLFGDENFMDTWFAMLLHTSTVSLVTSVKTDFGTLSRITLESLASKLSVNVTNQKLDDVLNTFASLPPHDDIKPALAQLRSAGFKVVALSNSSRNLITKQITNAGLNEYFDEVISVEEVNTFKPSFDAYKFASEKLKCDASDLRLVATHDWDTHGAMCAGLKAAYINRTGSIYNPLYRKTDINELTMGAVVEQIILTDA
ncbi:haloacid dehalogenase type II [Vibrio tritonius]|uniref:haloacid dehalogenase type II n=1 Tax=Vibrio tritonius TaxID=1435069 RepID=UPI0009EBBB20|nr:haloacid dehalogenase type II [Vibrio tritonius]